MSGGDSADRAVPRRRIAVGWALGVVAVVAPAGGQERYRSPYRVEFTVPRAELLADVEGTERGDSALSAGIARDDWYARSTRRRWNSWGPPARLYDPPEGLDDRPVAWKRQRVIAVATRFLGYGYQHHHVPDWDPPVGWPWKATAAGHDGKGVDCSNFTSFVYNQAFGVKLASDIDVQHKLQLADVPGLGRRVPLRRIELPAAYDERVKTLRTGDLLFFRASDDDRIAHVALWVGPIGRSAEGVPLVLDSRGSDVQDRRGKVIPAGVQLRPFREQAAYNLNASHALRLFPDE